MATRRRGGARRSASRRSSSTPFGITPRRERPPGIDVSLAIRRTRRAARLVLAEAREFGRAIEPGVRVLYTLPVVVAAALVALAARAGGKVEAFVLLLSRVLRPEWVVAAVALACAAALGAAQFVHFTGVEVDSIAYQGKIGTTAPVPVTQFRDTGTAHAYALLPVAAIAAVLILVSLRGNWRFGRLVALCGLIAIAVTLVIDLPKGLDAGSAGLAYNGAAAELSDGFYAQLASASMLFVSGLVLSRLLHQRRPAEDRPQRLRRPRRNRRPARGALITGRRFQRGAST